MSMQVTHPRALDDGAGPPPGSVDVRGQTVPLDEDDSFEVDDEAWVRQFANRYGVDVETIVDARSDEDVEELPKPGDITVDEDEDARGQLPLNPEEYTIDELSEALEDVDDEDALVAIRNLEVEQQDRTGATDVIDDRLEDVRED